MVDSISGLANVGIPAEAIKFEKQAWTCPVYGLNRGKGNHQECAQITQLKHQQEQEKNTKLNRR